MVRVPAADYLFILYFVLNLIMGIEGKCSSISFLYSMVVFTLNLLLKFYWPLFLSLLFVAQKVTKRHSTDKISRIALLLTNFRERKYCLRRTSAALVASVSKLPLTRWHELSSFVARLSATFPTERLRGSVQV